MATQADVRRVALSFAGAEESTRDFAFHVYDRKGKPHGFAWCWKERIDPKKARVPNLNVLAVRVPNLGHREALIDAEPRKFFTEPHYAGFPAVLVRIKEVTVRELRILLEDAWRTLVDKFPPHAPAAKRPAKRRPKGQN